jgi:signal transduction histidine kinase
MAPRHAVLPTIAIVRVALHRAPAAARHVVAWLVLVSTLMLALQAWDVSGRWGPQAAAEMLSVAAGVLGILLLGLVSAIGAGSAVFSAAEDDDLRPVLLALPMLAFAAGALISAAIAFMIARGLLGIHQGRVAGMSAFFLVALAFAWITVRDTTRVLFERAERRGAQAAKAREELTEARMAALQARMQPHFLFNALNTIAALVRTDPVAAEATVEDLSEILRASLKHGASAVRPFRDELALVRAYVGVEQRRFGERLAVRWEIASDVLDVAVPTLSLQPLVENAIKHGIASRMDGGAVTVQALRADDSIEITVTDEGDGFAAGWTDGTGLGNLRQRLASLYDGRAALATASGPGGRVTMTIPVRMAS